MAYFASKEEDDSFKFMLFSAVVVGLLTLLAGLRASSVGTDTTSYALPLYEIAFSSGSFADFYSASWYRIWRYVGVDSFEIGYLLLVWVSSRIGSFQVLLFLTSMLIVLPLYVAFAKKRNKVSLPICVALFMLVYFNTTMNGMRQWVAIAFVFLAVFAEYKDGVPLYRQVKVILCFLVALSFHTSAIIGLLVLLARIALVGERALERYFLITCLALLSLMLLSFAEPVLLSLGLEKYLPYIGSGSIHIVPKALLVQLPFFLLALYLYRSRRADDQVALFFLAMMTLSVIITQTASLGAHSARMGLYFDVFEIPLAGLATSSFANSIKNEASLLLNRESAIAVLIPVLCFVYGLVYWLYYYLYSGSGETVPYLFFWQ